MKITLPVYGINKYIQFSHDGGTLMGKDSLFISGPSGTTQMSSAEATKLLKWLIEREMRIHNEQTI